MIKNFGDSWVVHFHDQPILVSADVKDDAIVSNDTRGSKRRLDCCRACPICVRHFSKPCFESLFGIGVFMFFPERGESSWKMIRIVGRDYDTIPYWEQRAFDNAGNERD